MLNADSPFSSLRCVFREPPFALIFILYGNIAPHYVIRYELLAFCLHIAEEITFVFGRFGNGNGYFKLLLFPYRRYHF